MADGEEFTKEEQDAHEQLCLKIDQLVRAGDVSYDTALLALTAVMAQLCTEVDNEAELCLTMVEDLLSEFRYRMENRSTETVITIPDTN